MLLICYHSNQVSEPITDRVLKGTRSWFDWIFEPAFALTPPPFPPSSCHECISVINTLFFFFPPHIYSSTSSMLRYNRRPRDGDPRTRWSGVCVRRNDKAACFFPLHHFNTREAKRNPWAVRNTRCGRFHPPETLKNPEHWFRHTAKHKHGQRRRRVEKAFCFVLISQATLMPKALGADEEADMDVNSHPFHCCLISFDVTWSIIFNISAWLDHFSVQGNYTILCLEKLL